MIFLALNIIAISIVGTITVYIQNKVKKVVDKSCDHVDALSKPEQHASNGSKLVHIYKKIRFVN